MIWYKTREKLDDFDMEVKARAARDRMALESYLGLDLQKKKKD